ncbi:MAG: DMT family transporter [bacterium]
MSSPTKTGNKKQVKIEVGALGIIIAVVAMMLHSLQAIFGKLLVHDLSAETLTVASQLLGSVVILLFFGIAGEVKNLLKLSKKNMLFLLIFSLLAGALAPMLLYTGLQTSSSLNGTLLGRTEPVFAIIISILWLKEQFKIGDGISMTIMVIGMLTIVTKGFHEGINPAGGDVLIIASALSWAAATTIYKRFLPKVSQDIAVLSRNLIGAVCVLIVYPLVFHVSLNFQPLLDSRVFGILLLFAILVTVGAQMLWYKAVELTTVNKASQASLSKPFFGVIFAMLILGEQLLVFHWIGGVLIIGGLILTTQQGWEKKIFKKYISQKIEA